MSTFGKATAAAAAAAESAPSWSSGSGLPSLSASRSFVGRLGANRGSPSEVSSPGDSVSTELLERPFARRRPELVVAKPMCAVY